MEEVRVNGEDNDPHDEINVLPTFIVALSFTCIEALVVLTHTDTSRRCYCLGLRQDSRVDRTFDLP